ncbi:MAG: hypothetical protein K0R71_2213 [Bacillales bacterium]|jgi:hypothetical protein|nr:hypothetical protein [Bacillales bacterium]
MNQNATIRLVPASTQQEINIDEVMDFFKKYQEKNAKTGKQIDWEYGKQTFQYDIVVPKKNENKWFYLKSNKPGYHIIGVGVDQIDGQFYIQFSLGELSTHGDKNKALEFCKLLGEKYKAEVHFFNNRIMYYYPRK